MPITLTSLTDLAALGFDDIIDVRAPAEFAEDHLPGAISLPVLDDAERARVGTIYKQVNPFTARKLGAALVARNAAGHLLGPLADRPGGWRPLVYCWRGGQRSGSFATILAQIGWRVETLAGGYKAWRALVSQALYDRPFAVPMVVLDGNTGSAKTDLLLQLAARGVQVLDLEGMARHRGSLFGAMAGGQPSQKGFETRLAMAITALDPARPVVVEAESSRIGECRLPPGLWKAMQAAPRVAVVSPVAARARYLVRAYADLIEDPLRLADLIGLLRPLHGAEVIARWRGMAAAGAFEALALALMAEHYDLRYARHRARWQGQWHEVEAPDLGPEALPDVAARIEAAVARLSNDRRFMRPAYDAQDIDRAYANGAFIAGAEAYPPRWAALAAAFRQSLGPRAVLGVPYGTGARQQFDLFRPEGGCCGLLVFLHGGYWQAFGREGWSHLAAGALARGWACAMPSCTLAPEARIGAMVREVARAVDAAAALVPGVPVVVTGHSSGGHLSARLGSVGAPLAGKLARVVPISPLAELEPLMRTAMNAVLRLDAAEVAAESPARLRPGCDAHVWVGGDERPAFLWQARVLAEEWGCRWTVAAGRHHFDVIDALGDPQSALLEACLGGL